MAKNLLSSVGNTKTRTFVIFLATLVIITGSIIIFRSFSKIDPLEDKTSRAAAIPSSIKAIPGNEAPEKYRELQMEDNRRRVLEAYEKKTSAIPTIIGTVSTKDFSDKTEENSEKDARNLAFGDAQRGGFIGKNSPQSKSESEAGATLDPRIAKINKERERINQVKSDKEKQREADKMRQETAKAQSQYIDSIKQTSKAMQKHASSIFSNWNEFETQAYTEGVLANQLANKNDPTNTNNNKNKEPENNPLADPTKEFIKAGSVLFAVIETAINTDEPGPIMATIVSGRYKGGKLLGKVTHGSRDEKAILSFDTLSLPKYQNTIKIKSVAIDPDTARTALASDVDHHYLLRYGSLFASAFMSGYADAVGQSGTTITSPTGTITSTKPELTGREQFYTALGEIGKQWSKESASTFKKAYTVTIEQGVGVGVLFLSDVDVTAPPAPEPPLPTTAMQENKG